MDLKYYVLWKKDSPLLKYHLEKYYILILIKLQEIKELWILEEEISNLLKIDNRDFILNPDQSSLINLIYKELVEKKPQFLWDISNYHNLLSEQINLFLSWDQDKLSMNQWKKILWTNIRLTNIDNNPYNILECHPEHIQNWWVLWWWEKKDYEWLEVYERSFELLKKIDIWIYDELSQIIKKIIPLWTSFSLHNSASYKECIWHLYMWFTIDSWNPEINNLEAIIHESSHNKLNLIMQFEYILLNDYKELYYSAIRPDARPIYWVFLWYHAFAPTMYIIMKAYKNWFLWNDKSWFEKIILYYLKIKFLQKVIKKYAKFTKIWEEVSLEIDYVISKMDLLIKELKPSSAELLRAKENQQRHFEEVNKKYPYLLF